MDGGDVGDGAEAKGDDVGGGDDGDRQPRRLHEPAKALPQRQSRLHVVQLIEPLQIAQALCSKSVCVSA